MYSKLHEQGDSTVYLTIAKLEDKVIVAVLDQD